MYIVWDNVFNEDYPLPYHLGRRINIIRNIGILLWSNVNIVTFLGQLIRVILIKLHFTLIVCPCFLNLTSECV